MVPPVTVRRPRIVDDVYTEVHVHMIGNITCHDNTPLFEIIILSGGNWGADIHSSEERVLPITLSILVLIVARKCE
jgi:hypothetical protein